MGNPPSGKKVGVKDLIAGGTLQTLEAVTLGMPFEVWKTRMGRNREEKTIEAAVNVYKRGGLGAFWAGTGPKIIESATKGAVLLFAKEFFNISLTQAGVNETMAGFMAGAGAGVAQVSVMGPCTFLVTGAVTGDKSISTSQRIQTTWARHGLKGFYPGGVPLAFRQAGNWASREGFTVWSRNQIKKVFHDGDMAAKLSPGQEIMAAAMGGTLACWNHPFEVARIEMQARADQNQPKIGMNQVFKNIVQERGFAGLFRGIPPRIGLSIWQTLFMVTGGRVLKEKMGY